MFENFTSEDAKNSSEAVKNLVQTLRELTQPRGIDLAIMEGHKRIIERVTTREDLSVEAQALFVSSYKRMMKEAKNIKSVSFGSFDFISEDARPQDVETDWFNFFFDKVRLVSDENVQRMWSLILANEVNTPGKYSRALLHALSIMSTSQAEFFCNLARFCMFEYKNDELAHPLIFFSKNVDAYEKSGITLHGLLDLQQLGLIQCDFKDELVFTNKKVFRYGSKVIEVYGDEKNDKKIYAGNVWFTENGLALLGIVPNSYKKYRAEILDFTITKFQRRNCRVIINNRLVT